MIRITSKIDGFRRCGLAHPAAATDYPDDRFSDDELKALAAEPVLFVVSLPQESKTRANKAKDDK